MKKLASLLRHTFIKHTMLCILIMFSFIMVFLAPNFLTKANIKNVLLQSADLIIVACGVTFTVLNGGTDFSVTSIMALGSVVGASIMNEESGILAGLPFAVPVAIILMVAIGIAFGVVNGISVVKFKMPSFIVTLATMMLGSGIAVWYTKANSIYGLPKSFNFIGSGKLLFVPIPIVIAIVVILITNFILSKTLYGRQVYAVGTNHKTAFISGIPVKKVIFKMYIISGICASIAGIVMTARLESGVPGLASNMFLDIIASIIIGGTSIWGGSGSIGQTVVGALFVIIISNSLNLMGVSWFVINIVKGVIILCAAFVDVLKVKANMN